MMRDEERDTVGEGVNSEMMGRIVVIWREFLGKIRDFKGCFPMQSNRFLHMLTEQ